MWNTDAYSPDEWAILMQNAADDADAERAYQEMMDQDACMAEHAAADEDAERWYATNDDATTVETDLV